MTDVFRRNQHRWRQLESILRERVLDGTYDPDVPMPSETQLVQEFGVARNTVRKALKALRDEGLIYTVPQLGSFAAPVGRGGSDSPG